MLFGHAQGICVSFCNLARVMDFIFIMWTLDLVLLVMLWLILLVTVTYAGCGKIFCFHMLCFIIKFDKVIFPKIIKFFKILLIKINSINFNKTISVHEKIFFMHFEIFCFKDARLLLCSIFSTMIFNINSNKNFNNFFIKLINCFLLIDMFNINKLISLIPIPKY